MLKISLLLLLLTSFSYAGYPGWGGGKESFALYMAARANTWTGTNTFTSVGIGSSVFEDANTKFQVDSYYTWFRSTNGEQRVRFLCGSSSTNSGMILYSGAEASRVSLVTSGVSFFSGGEVASSTGFIVGATAQGDSTRWIDDATHGSGTTTLYIGNNTIDVTAPSDVRLKENISSLDAGLKEVLGLNPVNFEYNYKQGQEAGINAQNVQEVYPYAVYERSDGYLQTDYKKLIPLLINAIKEQQKQIEELRGMIK